MINIAVCCRSTHERSAQEQFDGFCFGLGGALVGIGTHKLGRIRQVGHLQFTRVTTSLDIRGSTFDGVVRLSELAPEVEQDLIACMRPPITRL